MAKKDPTNAEIADAFSELGTLYELDGADRFRVNAYRDAAKTMRQCPVSIAELTRAGKVTELPGIGKTSAEKIKALLDTGVIPSAEKLKAKFPATLVEVTRIPGLGAKTARRLFDEIGVASIDDLRQAIDEERIRSMKGLGPKAEENIAAQLEKLGAEGPAERVLLSDVLPIAEKLAADLRDHPASDAVAVAGSARRLAETCKDVDLIATAYEPKALATGAGRPSACRRVGQPGPGRSQDHDSERRLDRPADRRARGLRQPPPALHRVGRAQRRAPRARGEDGPLRLRARDHRRRVGQSRTVRHRGRGLRAPRPGVHRARASRRRAARSRRRETASCPTSSRRTTSRATSTPTRRFPTARTSLRRWSTPPDPSATPTSQSPTTPLPTASATTSLRRCSRSGSRRSPSSTSGSPRSRFRVLAGSEVNILTDGSLDYEDSLLERLDWVVASVHTSFRMTQRRT